MKLVERLKCLFLGHGWEFSRNVYGDEINMLGGKRSVWICWKCLSSQYRPDLYGNGG